MFSGFTFGANSITEEVGFPEENIFVYCLLCLIAVLVILSIKDPKIMLA